MDRRETERLLDAIGQARAAGELAAVATVVRVKGSAYRREGTRMFVRQNGTAVRPRLVPPSRGLHDGGTEVTGRLHQRLSSSR